ncbi:hypothetical protein IWQ51_002080 [Labrenzia sp. EL_142]|nr:hypothetical protein [Labrenzia sp. EL_142]
MTPHAVKTAAGMPNPASSLGQTTKIDATGGFQAGRYFTETPIIVKTPVIRGVQLETSAPS